MADITVTWLDPNDSNITGRTDEDGYNVYRNINEPVDINNLPTPIATTGANSTFYTDTSVQEGVNYFYKVAAVKGDIKKFGIDVSTLASSYTGHKIQKNISGTDYFIHYFFKSGFLNIGNNTNFDYLIVGAGGSGGSALTIQNSGGGGGGGGEVLTGSSVTTQTDYQIIVGKGGNIQPDGASQNGEDTNAFGIQALGGGRGATVSNNADSYRNPGNGGNGGGNFSNFPGGVGINTGFTGGTSNTSVVAGGGAGAGGNGVSAVLNSVGGDGGPGITSNITGENIIYGAGGPGFNNSSYNLTHPTGVGGSPLVGDVYNFSLSQTKTSNYYGHGGPGGSPDTIGSSKGGDGIVIIRYLVPPPPQT